jgi:hypothetical protein
VVASQEENSLVMQGVNILRIFDNKKSQILADVFVLDYGGLGAYPIDKREWFRL